MHCPSCGVEVGDKDQFCRHCGGRLRATGTVPPTSRSKPPLEETLYTRNSSHRTALWALVYLALAVASGFAVYAVLNRGPKTGAITLGTPRLLVVSPSPSPTVVSDGGIASPPHTRKRLSRTAGKETTPKAPGSRKKPASPTPPEPTKKEPAHTPKGEEPEGKEAPKKPAPKPGPEQPASKKPAPKPGPKQPTEPPPAKGDKRKEAADAIDRFRAGLNADSVRMVVRHHLPQVRVCYDRALKQKPDLAGIVEIRFTISDKGRVGASSVYRNTSGHDGLGKCLAITIKRWRFPRPVGGAMDFVYPFVFSSSN